MQASLLLLALALNGPSAPRVAAAAAPENPVLQNCLVSLVDEATVSGEEASKIIALEAKEGMYVKAGTVLGRMDDRAPVAQKRIAVFEYNAAAEQAKNDINVRFADASADVAKVELQKAQEANLKVPGTNPDVEINRLRLTHKKSELQIEQAALEQKVAILTAKTKSAEVDAVDLSIKRRQITAPIDGVIVTLYKHVGDWVAIGDPVLRIVRMDKLRVEGFVNASKYNPADIQGHAVSVRVELERGRVEEFRGKIVFVSPLVEGAGDYRVFAEVENRMDNNHFVLRPGLNAEMTIHVNADLAKRMN